MMTKKIKDLVKGDKIKFEYGDYGNWAIWTYDHYESSEDGKGVKIYGYPANSKELEYCWDSGTIESSIEVSDPVAEHCSRCGKPMCVSDNKNYYRGRAFCDECVKGHN